MNFFFKGGILKFAGDKNNNELIAEHEKSIDNYSFDTALF